jgi:tRNA (mo5U34)-methyltransferase
MVIKPESTKQSMNDTIKLRREIEKIKWWHKIDLGNGVITPGIDITPEKLKWIQMSQNLAGKSVLDIGAWDGFFSFEAERRGARRVLAIDSHVWKNGAKEGFELARKVLGSKVEDKEIDVMDISPENIGIFDYVLFLGVLYHLRHPLLALEKVSSVTKEQLVLETHVELIGGKRPVMAFYAGNEMNNDPTNWCGPNPSAIRSILQDVGFREVKCIYKTPLITRIENAILNRGHHQIPFWSRTKLARMVFHAWK